MDCANYHHLISAYGEFEDAEQSPTGSTDETCSCRGGEWCEDSYARGSENVPCLVFSTGTEELKGLSRSSWRNIRHRQPVLQAAALICRLQGKAGTAGNVKLHNSAQRRMQL